MEDAYEILNYLPIKFGNEKEQEYIKFLWESFESNYNNGKYQFAFMGYHMLFMSLVYINIWQIKLIHPNDYKKITLGFNPCFENATSPFTFSLELESKIFTIFRFLGLNTEKIGKYKKIVKLRNDIAHSNGNIYFNDRESLDEKISEILKFAEEIQMYSKESIQDKFENFLIESQDEELRQYVDVNEEIQEALIKQYYLSQKDIEFCLEYNFTKLSKEPHFSEIEMIYESIKTEFIEEEDV